jgi:tetratricopeptide (TPR) repeat protein
VIRGLAPFWKILGILALTLILSCHSRRSVNRATSPAADSILNTAAIAPYTDSIRSHPRFAVYYFKRSELLYGMQQFRHSLADIEQASRLSPDEAAYYYALGEVYLALQRPDSARMSDAKALQLTKGDPQVRLRLADILFQMHADSASLEQLDTLLKLDPKNGDGHGLRSQILEKEGDTAAALAEMQEAVRYSPDNFDAFMALGDLYSATGNPKALGWYHKAFLLDKAQGEPLYATGLYYEKRHQDDKAIAALKQCITTDHFYPDAYLRLGEIYNRHSDLKQAEAMYTVATRVDPRNAEGFYRLGACEESSGNRSGALEHYRQAYALNRNFAEAKAGIQRLQ